jgi:hypothetical protein
MLFMAENPYDNQTKSRLKIVTYVLIVASGPAGSPLPALLSAQGVKSVLVTRYRLAETARVHTSTNTPWQ